ncbi:hypothetical protein J2S13_002808 [Oikeobacillus pervagus]|uniref:DUF1836 domain-containing protein n=1 Tax=Oikeobacillus pervagus TaxID=1325931 RepID=A0AAJ1T845_9BACI|nr:DUF1836 domain-containing protein [Oikeobacillus pervagus]MDQ0216350.1 hypothetical protein [Oikeobacillus pervagus]
MTSFSLTRKDMSDLLFSLKGWNDEKPLSILQKIWMRSQTEKMTISSVLTMELSPILEKIMKLDTIDIGLSLNEIVTLGSQIEKTNFSLTAVQNWVKRDIKDMIGSPQKKKRYSIEQTALLFIVEDLKTTLDFDSIRKLLNLIVNDPENPTDDLINPIALYSLYSTVFEQINQEEYYLPKENHIQVLSERVEEKASNIIQSLNNVHEHQKEAIKNMIMIATLSVHTAYFQMLAKRYVSATLFLQDLNH